MLILIVEDEYLVGQLTAECLVDAGFDVAGPAATLADAIDLAAAKRPDLALVDIDLKDGDSGIDVAHMLAKLWSVPALFASGQVGTARANRDAAMGLVAKPYSVDTIIGAIRYVEAHQQGRSGPAIPLGLELFDPPGIVPELPRTPASSAAAVS